MVSWTRDAIADNVGNSTEICGGPNRISAFNYTLGIPVAPPPVLPTGWVSTGCMTDAGSIRSLAGYSFTSSSMTRELCMSTCLAKGYTLAGTEYSKECYCANSYTTGSILATSGCSMACSGEFNRRSTELTRRQLYCDLRWTEPTYRLQLYLGDRFNHHIDLNEDGRIEYHNH